MAFCLNTLLDPGYIPNGTWLQVSNPAGATMYTPVGADGCIEDWSIESDKLTVTGESCPIPGTYTFSYDIPGLDCIDPAFVEVDIVDSPTEIATPDTLYVCRDGSEVVGADHTFMLANGSTITNYSIDAFFRQCDGVSIIDYSLSATTGGSGIADFENSFTLIWNNIDNIVNSNFGFTHITQSCTTININTFGDLNCGDQLDIKMIVSPDIEGYNSTLVTCDTVNVYDNMPTGLVTFLNNVTFGPPSTIGGEALFNIYTVGYNGCTSTGQIRIQSSTDNGVTWKNILISDTVDPLLNPTIQYKVIWIPEGVPAGFDCGGISILTIDTDNCCTEVTDISFLSGGFITDPIPCSTADIALLNNGPGSLILEANQDTVWWLTEIDGTVTVVSTTATTIEIELASSGSYDCDGAPRQFRFNVTATSCGVAYTEEVTIRIEF